MRKFLMVCLMLVVWSTPALAGHIEVLYQDGSRERLDASVPVSQITVVMEPQSLVIQYRDGSQEVMHPDPGTVVTALNIYFHGEYNGHAELFYTSGASEVLTPEAPVKRLDVIVNQHLLNVVYMDGRNEIVQPSGALRQVSVTLY